MKYRKLRIAWSVGCGILCLLLTVLWVRSYSWIEVFGCINKNGSYMSIGSKSGAVYYGDGSGARTFNDPVFPDGWHYRCFPGNDESVWELGNNTFPYAIPTLAFATFAILPFLWQWRWRFSLRTLLIATTVVAVVLGAIIHATS